MVDEKKELNGVTLSMIVKWRDKLPRYMTYHTEYPDVDIDDILNGFLAIMVGQTWNPQMVLCCMRDFANERLEDDENTED